ncbi:hypothetical protein [Aquipuribacter sp. MA13-13]
MYAVWRIRNSWRVTNGGVVTQLLNGSVSEEVTPDGWLAQVDRAITDP